MQSDKDFFKLIKETYPLTPRQEFVVITERKLRQRARKIEKKKSFTMITSVSSGFVLFALAMSWIFFFGGKELIINNLSSYEEGRTISNIEENEPSVFIYHSHNWESFIPEIHVEDPNEAFHETNNISLVGERLSQALKERDIFAIHDKTNVEEVLQERGLKFPDSYKVTRETLIEALENEKSIQMVFDIHRDSQRRKATTINIDGVDYARIAIVISHSSNNYDKNRKFALLMHQKLEERYPGLSRGVLDQSGENQSTYNQDLLDNSLLLEIGGVDNTLEEGYRTVDALAEAISEIIQKD